MNQEAGMAYAVVDKHGREVHPHRRERLDTVVARAEDEAAWRDDDLFVVDENGGTVHVARRAS